MWILPAFAALVIGASAVCGAPSPRPTTTVYVARHFEVREDDAPVKYVFNGETRIARVTGSLSANERIQRLRLRAGWNLVSLAITAQDFLGQLKELTSGPAPVIKALHRWQPVTKDFGAIAPGESLAAGTVLWVAARTDAVVAVRGRYVEPREWRAPAGGAFLAVPALQAQPLVLPPGVTVWRFDARSGRWQIGLPGDLASLSDLPKALAPGEAIYVHTNDPMDLEAPAREERIHYYHQDHLGSSAAVTDADGRLVEETAFYPFGQARRKYRPRQVEEPYQFTQKERDEESGLHYFGKRFHAPAIGRWLSTDPMEERGGSLNPYAFVNHNPLKYRDADGGEITVTPTYSGSGKDAKIVHYEIKVKAVLVNLSPKLEKAGYDRAKVEQFAAKLKSAIETSYSGQQGKVTWRTTVDLKVIDRLDQAKQGEHVFRLVDRTYSGSRGTSTEGGLWMEIAASTLFAPRPAKPGSVKDYLSPESTGAHELGHTGGLGHWQGATPNLMQEGSKREFDNRTITLGQIEQIHSKYAAGELNQGSSFIGSWEDSRKR